MAETPYSICSRALVRAGCAQISSFDDGTTEANVAGEEYEPAVKAALSAHRWRFAAKQDSLVALTETPLDRWDYYLQLPSDLIVLHAVYSGGVKIEFDRYGDRVACNYNDGVVADYTYRAGETKFPPYFLNALTLDLEATFLRAIRRDDSAADAIEKAAFEKWWPIARNLDSQQQTTRKFASSRLVTIRG